MKLPDRQWATVIVWITFIIMILLVFDRGLLVSADFADLWPQMPAYTPAQDAAELNQVAEAAREALPGVMATIQESIRAEIAVRVPVVIAISVMLILAATLCTWFIWRNAGLEAYLAREAVQAEKAKRRGRIEQFMDELDPEELTQLRARLTGEGERKGKG